MTTIRPFQPTEPLAGGRTIIEASAGTGKTFTIAAVATRLVAVQGVALDRLLIVTFTRAATAELKGRVWDRLAKSLGLLEGRHSPERDDYFDALATLAPPDRDLAVERLRDALTEFDKAQIFTIHGFAQRLLGGLGFRARLAETLEPGEIDDLMLRQVASDLVVARFSATQTDEIITPGDAAALGRSVIDRPDAEVVPAVDAVEGMARLRVEMATSVAAEARRRMRRTGAITFDDGLLEVRDALAEPGFGEAAAEVLRRRYDVGLVDESQDTDPIQWEIIRRIFDGKRLVVIGDPKQSIYAFRGADIESYMSALHGAVAHTTLATNWRSDGPLVSALDSLFSGATFGDDRIEYREVDARHTGSRIDGAGAALRLRLVGADLDLPRYKHDPYYRVDPLRGAVAADAADEVVRLLGQGITIHHRVDDQIEPLGAGDIAILCRTAAQVGMVRRELARRSVPSVAARTGAVFTSEAAEDWRRFLIGLERPERMDMVKLAASTRLVGFSLAALATLDDDGALNLQSRMRDWQDTLQAGGVPALLAELTSQTDLVGRVLGAADGERILTDLNHIAEEMHFVSRRGRVGSLSAWLTTAMQEAQRRERNRVEEPESRQRRLETDAAAVVVQTVHAAKGLEYPVVLVPFAWDVSLWDSATPVFHDPAAAAAGEPRRRQINLGGRGSPGFDDHVALARQEEAAEEARLLYVALTRARHHMEVWWVENHAKKDDAMLTELLTGNGRTPETLAVASAGTIEVSHMSHLAPPRVHTPPTQQDPVVLEVARLDRTPDQAWRRVSFSSLSADQPLAAVDERSEELLRTDEAEVPDDEVDGQPAPLLPMADLPAGARFGTLVHDLLENVRFDDPDLEGSILGRLEEPMRTGGWEFDPAVLAAGLAAACATPLGPSPADVTLSALEATGLTRELVFELPVRTVGDPAALADIGRIMDAHLPPTDPYRAYVTRLVDSPSPPFRGFMTGAIDLVAKLPDGRYVVMDYKSNSLRAAGEVAGPGDYGPNVLAGEMVSHHYVLQATLYQVALHRYLRWRLPGYDPALHLGGSAYLFIRGMIGPDTPIVNGARCGVARWQPPVEVIVALSETLERGEP